jgi:hypothetical protein
VLSNLIAKALHLALIGDVGDVRGDAQALWQSLQFAKPLGLRHRSGRKVAHGNVAALGDQLPHELAAHPRAAAGDYRNPVSEVFHFCSPGSTVGAMAPTLPSARYDHLPRRTITMGARAHLRVLCVPRSEYQVFICHALCVQR